MEAFAFARVVHVLASVHQEQVLIEFGLWHRGASLNRRPLGRPHMVSVAEVSPGSDSGGESP